ncbi:MAG: hypothetical protein HKM03_00995 [Steroidobacteraceae bacterium]|nr:hypothetical protein [Steroidobacteraceae bacterium]
MLHLAYAWLPVGLAMKAAALLGGFAIAAFWLHALTIGALSTMILGMMTRVSLGHTGRALIVTRPMQRLVLDRGVCDLRRGVCANSLDATYRR